MEIPGGGGSTVKPPGTENPGGWGFKLEKKPSMGGMDIFWNHTFTKKFNSKQRKKQKKEGGSEFQLPNQQIGI